MADRGSQEVQSQISELKVSGHTMALEPGMYCLFSAPGGPAPDSATGLPGVRITAAPGPSVGLMELVGLDQGGWIGPDAATLVRVKTRSELLVTVYQAPNSQNEAPKLQVVRISGPSAVQNGTHVGAQAGANGASQAEAPPAAPAATPIEVVAHVYGLGDVGVAIGQWAGDAGSKRWIEGFGIVPSQGIPAADIEYQAVLGRGWLSPWSEGGQFCGSRGMSLPILGLRVRLRGPSAATHRIALQASFVDGTRIGPVADGQACEAPSLAALEAFLLDVQPIGAGTPSSEPKSTPTATPDTAKPKAAKPGKKAGPSAPAPPPPAPPPPEPPASLATKPAARTGRTTRGS